MYRCHFLSLQQGRCLEKSLTRRTHFKYRLLRIAAHPPAQHRARLRLGPPRGGGRVCPLTVPTSPPPLVPSLPRPPVPYPGRKDGERTPRRRRRRGTRCPPPRRGGGAGGGEQPGQRTPRPAESPAAPVPALSPGSPLRSPGSRLSAPVPTPQPPGHSGAHLRGSGPMDARRGAARPSGGGGAGGGGGPGGGSRK